MAFLRIILALIVFVGASCSRPAGSGETDPFYFVDRLAEAQILGSTPNDWHAAHGEMERNPSRDLIHRDFRLGRGTRSEIDFGLASPYVYTVSLNVEPGAKPFQEIALRLAHRPWDLGTTHDYRNVDIHWQGVNADGSIRYQATFNTLPQEEVGRLVMVAGGPMRIRSATIALASTGEDFRSFATFGAASRDTERFPWRKYLRLENELRKSIWATGNSEMVFNLKLSNRPILEGACALAARNSFASQASMRIAIDGVVVFQKSFSNKNSGEVGRWHPFSLDLSSYSGRDVRLSFHSVAASGEAPLFVWGAPILFSSHRDVRKNVLVISIDALNARHLMSENYARATTPFLSSLASRAAFFQNFIVQYGGTAPSLLSMIHSKQWVPEVHSHEDRSILGLAKQAGYLVHMNGYLIPGAGFTDSLETFQVDFGGATDRELLDRTFGLLRAHHQRGAFLWTHLNGGHVRAILDPPYRDLFEKNSDLKSRFQDLERTPVWAKRMSLLPDERKRIVLDYDRRLRQADDLLKEYWGRAERAGLLKDTLVVITADHGEDFFDHNPSFRGHGILYDSVVRVPLLWIDPEGKFAGKRMPALVRGIDLAPTLVEYMGLSAPKEYEGESVMPLLHGDGTLRRAALTFAPCADHAVFALRTDRYKFIYSPTGCQPAWPEGFTYASGGELYDLQVDPGERVNLAGSDPELADAFKLWVNEASKELLGKKAGPERRGSIFEELLRMAGYVK